MAHVTARTDVHDVVIVGSGAGGGTVTSKIGTERLGYRGNGYLGEFKVPSEVLDYINKRSPL